MIFHIRPTGGSSKQSPRKRSLNSGGPTGRDFKSSKQSPRKSSLNSGRPTRREFKEPLGKRSLNSGRPTRPEFKAKSPQTFLELPSAHFSIVLHKGPFKHKLLRLPLYKTILKYHRSHFSIVYTRVLSNISF